jgi:hypothetical protein
MISLASVLASASIFRASLNKKDFRKLTTDVTLNFRGALTTALAEVSMDLDYRSSIDRYENYTNLDEYPDAKTEGYNFLSYWQKEILAVYPGLGLNLSIVQPVFQCNWDANPGFLSYHFYGWKNRASLELNLKILNLNETDGKTVNFYFQLLKENGAPVTDLLDDMTTIFFQHSDSNEFTLSRNFNLTYLGSGYYSVGFSMYSSTILEGINEIKDYANLNMTTVDFVPGYNSTMLINLMDQVIIDYNLNNLVEAHNNMTEAKMWIAPNENTTFVLAWIDIVRSQLLPRVRISLQDSRGIVVGAFRELFNIEGDNCFSKSDFWLFFNNFNRSHR